MASVKSYILQIKKQIDSIRKSDGRAKKYVKDIADYEDQQKDLFGQLQCMDELYPDDKERAEMTMMINENLEELNKLHKMVKAEYQTYMTNKSNNFLVFKSKYAGLFDDFIMGTLDHEALLHCLDTFSLYSHGELSDEQAKEIGWYKFHDKGNLRVDPKPEKPENPTK